MVLAEDDHAVVEGDFVGIHTAEFAGIAATGRSVRVPIAVSYDLKDGAITSARIYFELPVLMAQLTAG